MEATSSHLSGSIMIAGPFLGTLAPGQISPTVSDRAGGSCRMVASSCMSGSRTRACVPLMNTHPRSSAYLSSNETRAAISANPSRQLYGNGRLLADLELRDLVSMHFVWAIGKPEGTGMCIGMGKAKVLRHAGTAVRLDGPVDHLAGNVGRMYFDHGDLFASSLVAGD